jgi:hypothetical protein
VTHLEYTGIKNPISILFSTGILSTYGLSIGSASTGAPLAGGGFFLAFLSAAATFSASSFLFFTSSSVSSLSSYAMHSISYLSSSLLMGGSFSCSCSAIAIFFRSSYADWFDYESIDCFLRFFFLRLRSFRSILRRWSSLS